MDRKQNALKLHEHGFNCAQSVACSFCNVMGADPETVFKLAEPFGFGMSDGNLRRDQRNGHGRRNEDE